MRLALFVRLGLLLTLAVAGCTPAAGRGTTDTPGVDPFDQAVEVSNLTSERLTVKYTGHGGSGPFYLGEVGPRSTATFVLPDPRIVSIYAENEQGRVVGSARGRSRLVRFRRVSLDP